MLVNAEESKQKENEAAAEQLKKAKQKQLELRTCKNFTENKENRFANIEKKVEFQKAVFED